MGWSEWVKETAFTDIWRQAFEDVQELFDTGERKIEQARAYAEKESLWMEIREPLAGVRLITAEMPLTVTPVSLSLRVWTYEEENELYVRLSQGERFSLAGQPMPRYPDQKPQPSWQRQLDSAGVRVKGVRYVATLEGRIEEKSVTTRSDFRQIVVAFADYVLAAWQTERVAPSVETAHLAQLQEPDTQEPVEQETPTALPSSDPVGAGEVLVSAASDMLDVDHDPRFEGQGQPTRVALVNARIGQGGYRDRMLQIWGGSCALSGCTVQEVLIASHARAWRDCVGADDCLDEYNGLLLSANLDRLFDRGLISFDDEGRVLITPGFGMSGLVQQDKLRFVHARHLPYLHSHRLKHGFA